MKNIVCFCVLAFLSSAALAGKKLLDKNGVDLVEAEKVYTLVNLHPDNERGVLYSVNYQLPALMPMCSEVDILKLSKKKMVFKLLSTGREYTYVYHKKSTPMPFADYLQDFFGLDCSKASISKMSKKDQDGIKLGRPMVGMSRDGVLLAMGRPPHHVTPLLDASEWMYWRNKFARTAVMFDEKGIVKRIR